MSPGDCHHGPRSSRAGHILTHPETIEVPQVMFISKGANLDRTPWAKDVVFNSQPLDGFEYSPALTPRRMSAPIPQHELDVEHRRRLFQAVPDVTQGAPCPEDNGPEYQLGHRGRRSGSTAQ